MPLCECGITLYALRCATSRTACGRRCSGTTRFGLAAQDCSTWRDRCDATLTLTACRWKRGHRTRVRRRWCCGAAFQLSGKHTTWTGSHANRIGRANDVAVVPADATSMTIYLVWRNPEFAVAPSTPLRTPCRTSRHFASRARGRPTFPATRRRRPSSIVRTTQRAAPIMTIAWWGRSHRGSVPA